MIMKLLGISLFLTHSLSLRSLRAKGVLHYTVKGNTVEINGDAFFVCIEKGRITNYSIAGRERLKSSA